MTAVLRVVSWNIRFGVEVGVAIDEISAEREMCDFDILLLQEMGPVGTAAIAEALGGEYAYASAAPHVKTGREFGNAVVSRWPITEWAEVALPHVAPVSGQPRSATHTSVRVGAQEISVYSTHTEIPALRLARRIEQFAVIGADIRDRGHERVIVGGDFNTVTARGVQALTEEMRSAGLERLSSPFDASYRARGRELILDHIFGTGFRALASGVVEGTTASDHDPVWVELEPIRS